MAVRDCVGDMLLEPQRLSESSSCTGCLWCAYELRNIILSTGWCGLTGMGKNSDLAVIRFMVLSPVMMVYRPTNKLCVNCLCMPHLLQMQATVHAVIYTCQLLCQELSTISRRLLHWGSNDPSIVGKRSSKCSCKQPVVRFSSILNTSHDELS